MGSRGLRSRLIGFVAVVGALTVAAFGIASAASGSSATGAGIAASFKEGSSSFRDCSSATSQAHIFGMKVTKSGAVGSYAGIFNQTSSGVEASHTPNNPLVVTISNVSTLGSIASFDWSANLPVDYIYVKAGSGANVYDYSSYTWGGHPASGPFADTGLVSPTSSISHILFCTVKKLRVEKTAAGSFTRKHTWDIAKTVKTDGEYAASASLTRYTGESGDAMWKISVTKTGEVDSDMTVAGGITVLNASPFSANVKLTELLAGATFGAGCPSFTLGIGAAKSCSYSAGVPSLASGTNTVTAKAENLSWMAVARRIHTRVHLASRPGLRPWPGYGRDRATAAPKS